MLKWECSKEAFEVLMVRLGGGGRRDRKREKVGRSETLTL